MHDGFRLPGEFEKHAATWLLWPVRGDNWRFEAFFAQQDMLALAVLIAHFESVRVGVLPSVKKTLLSRLPSEIKAHAIEYDDTWVRDTGPSILVSPGGSKIAIDWKFNSWGGLFSDSSADDLVAKTIADIEGVNSIKAPIVLEGGAIICDGCGTLITTEESVCIENRNPGLNRKEAEDIFRKYLNIEKTIWIPQGLINDEAGGHIDNVCLFASENLLLVANEPDSTKANYSRLKEAQNILRSEQNARGKQYELVVIDVPPMLPITKEEACGFLAPEGTIERSEGTPLAPSYMNSYVLNGAVIVPTFNEASDETALEIFAKCFPTRKIIPFYSREFLLGGGAIHCIAKEIF